jgi:hypothetical protein
VCPILSNGFPTTQLSLKSWGWVGWARAPRVAWFTIPRVPRWSWSIAFLAVCCAIELHTSWIRSAVFARAARHITYAVEEGSSPSIRYPHGGPYDRRLGYALLHAINPRHRPSGGSTIATQLEKFRHSPSGRTDSITEKGRQIISASLRTYLDGARTLHARKRLVTDYLNSIPLGAIAGYGEIHGIGDGLRAWYDADVQAVNEMLAEDRLQPDGPRESPAARAFRQVLSLLVAVKKPSEYLSRDRKALDALVKGFLQALASADVIPPWLRDEARRLRVEPRDRVPPAAATPSMKAKAFDAVRAELSSRLGLDNLYDLDRLDVAIRTTLDGGVNDQVTNVLQRLGNREYAAQAGLMSPPMLGNDNPGRVVYGVTLYERGPNGNELRVQADNYHQPLNINQGTKLELGSTAKLRTLTTYLETVEGLHAQYAAMTNEALRVAVPRDRLSRWAVEHLTGTTDRSLPAMLEAAMNRRYSASPAESFFTGGGLHRFHNFDAKDNRQALTVREAFERSVNLVFIRLMRDLVRHHSFGVRDAARILENKDHPGRTLYLGRFADREGSEFLRKFYRKHRMAAVDVALEKLVHAQSSSAVRVGVLYRSTRPDAELGEFATFLQAHGVGRNLSAAKIRTLYERYDPERWSLNDRGYLAGVHPLELWLLRYLRQHPEATLAEVLTASDRARHDGYRWLFKTSNKRAQDQRILAELEIEAFAEIHASWRRHGYRFPSLVPSYATPLEALATTRRPFLSSWESSSTTACAIVRFGSIRYVSPRARRTKPTSRTGRAMAIECSRLRRPRCSGGNSLVSSNTAPDGAWRAASYWTMDESWKLEARLEPATTGSRRQAPRAAPLVSSIEPQLLPSRSATDSSGL